MSLSRRSGNARVMGRARAGRPGGQASRPTATGPYGKWTGRWDGARSMRQGAKMAVRIPSWVMAVGREPGGPAAKHRAARVMRGCNGGRAQRRGRGRGDGTGKGAGDQAAHRAMWRGGESREAQRPSIAPYRNGTACQMDRQRDRMSNGSRNRERQRGGVCRIMKYGIKRLEPVDDPLFGEIAGKRQMKTVWEF